MAQATKTRAKPKATKATASKAPAKKAPAKKASKAATKKPDTANLLPVDTFVKFSGYRSDVSKEEAIFSEGQTLYIVEIDDTGDDGILYNVIDAADIAEFRDGGLDAVDAGQVSPSEVSELKGTALDKAKDQYMPITIVGKLADLLAENNDAIEVAVELNQEIQETYFWLGGALARILQEGSYLKENGGDYEGDDAWSDFCQAEFGFKGSKGRQLARLYITFSELPDFDPDKLAGIGWSIAAKVAKYVTPENVDEVLEVASNETQRTVDATMRERFVSEAGTTPSGKPASRGVKILTKTLSYRLEENSAETIELAIKSCMAKHGIDSPALALERICLEWAQENVDTPTALKRITGKAAKGAKVREAAEKAKEEGKTTAKAAPKATAKKAPAKKTGGGRRRAA